MTITGVYWGRVALLLALGVVSVIIFGDERTGNAIEYLNHRAYIYIPIALFVLKFETKSDGPKAK